MQFLKLIHYKNLLLIIITQVLIKYALLETLKIDYGISTALSGFSFFLLVFATVCIAAAGYIINAIETIEADKINNPDRVIIGKYISEKKATNLFFALNIIGVISGFILAGLLERSSFASLFILASLLLYMYATFLKRVTFVGNIIIPILVSICILLVGVFDLIPVMTYQNRASQVFFMDLIKDYAILAFIITFLRALVIDLKNIDGDYKIGIQSLAIVLGRHRASKVAFVVSLVPLFAVIFYLTQNLYKQPLAIGYVLLFIIGPLLYCCIKLFSAEQKNHYHHINVVLKVVMLTAILSLLLFQFMLLK